MCVDAGLIDDWSIVHQVTVYALHSSTRTGGGARLVLAVPALVGDGRVGSVGLLEPVRGQGLLQVQHASGVALVDDDVRVLHGVYGALVKLYGWCLA